MASFLVNYPTVEQEAPAYLDITEVTFPITEEIAKSLTIGESVDFSAIGVVKEIGAGYSDSGEHTLRIRLSSVKVEVENEFEKMARDEEAD